MLLILFREKNVSHRNNVSKEDDREKSARGITKPTVPLVSYRRRLSIPKESSIRSEIVSEETTKGRRS